MTGCMYISHDQNDGNLVEFPPVILADTVATYVDKPDLPPIIPTTATHLNISDDSSTFLVRKLYIVENKMALAFCGDVSSIMKCYTFVKENISVILKSDRPMKYIQDKANEYSGTLWLVGASIMSHNAVNHLTTPPSEILFPTLGKCYVTGSGRDRIIELASMYIDEVKHSSHSGIPGQEFALHVNAIRLAEELSGDPGNWGGYIEHSILNIERHQWVRGPRTAHLFAIARMIDSSLHVDWLPNVIAYDPGITSGRVLSGMNGSSNWVQFLLSDVDATEESDVDDTRNFWDKWQPEVATATVTVDDGSGNIGHLVHVMDGDSLTNFAFSISGDIVEVGLSDTVLDHLRGLAFSALTTRNP